MVCSKVWVDMINPSHVLFFKSLLPELLDYDFYITTRNRAETVKLADQMGIKNQVIGRDYCDPIKKTGNMIYRTLNVAINVPNYDASLSFENGMCILASKLRNKHCILFCDNDLKFSQKKMLAQDMETKVKSLADNIIIPECCLQNFKNVYEVDKLKTYEGYKEDIYIADYKPDPYFLDKIPFKDFIVIRPEALNSLYVKENSSIVTELIDKFKKECINVIYLPRDSNDVTINTTDQIYVPSKPLNGLDIAYYAKVVLTGSGTMAREAARIGTPAVSFFPSDKLLSVDQQLVNEGKIFHSRDIEEIFNYVLSKYKPRANYSIEKSKTVKNEVVNITKEILCAY